MSEFDLIARVKEVGAERALATRVERLKPFAKRHSEFAADYVSSPPLTTAVNVALSLGRPLLLTGEPGSGKTLAAYWLANVFGLGEVLEFHVKSDSHARDLCYQFDAVSWFRELQIINKEGGSIVIAKQPYLHPGPLGKAFGWSEGTSPKDHVKPIKPSVVLVDEIDKAPRDFPNDLLLELDQMEFSIVETDEKVRCDPEMRPIMIITSNAERRLPDPFLRRCVIHRIRLEQHEIVAILGKRLKEFGVDEGDAFIPVATEFWQKLSSSLTRKPTLDEYWRWLALLTAHGGVSLPEVSTALQTPGPTTRKLPFIGTILSDQDLDRVIGEVSS